MVIAVLAASRTNLSHVYRGSPWLDLLLKLDVVCQASIPSRDNLSSQTHTPLRCVTRVRSVKVLADCRRPALDIFQALNFGVRHPVRELRTVQDGGHPSLQGLSELVVHVGGVLGLVANTRDGAGPLGCSPVASGIPAPRSTMVEPDDQGGLPTAEIVSA
jgi:hypothetical protein